MTAFFLPGAAAALVGSASRSDAQSAERKAPGEVSWLLRFAKQSAIVNAQLV